MLNSVSAILHSLSLVEVFVSVAQVSKHQVCKVLDTFSLTPVPDFTGMDTALLSISQD